MNMMMKHEKISESIAQNNTTPMMHQYLVIKEAHPNYLLFYRMGDFYEMFFDDALIASKELEIVLTKRGTYNDKEIPMCGVPAHSSEFYLQRLIKRGYSVAICEQLETPQEAKKRGYKSVVRREVTRIITPGTLMEETLLNAKEMNYLCSIHKVHSGFILAYAEISTGAFFVQTLDEHSLETEIARLNPSEIVLSDKTLNAHPEWHDKFHSNTMTIRSHSIYDLYRNEKRLLEFYKVDFLEGLGTFTENEIIAGGVLLEYLQYTQKNHVPQLKLLRKINCTHFMSIDKHTRKSLELERNFAGERKDCLIDVLDQTMTSGGARLLSLYLTSPLTNIAAINKRLDNIENFVNQKKIREEIREILKHLPDVERALSRITSNRCTYNDLIIIHNGISIYIDLAEFLELNQGVLSQNIINFAKQIGNFGGLIEELKSALNVKFDESQLNGDSIFQKIPQNQNTGNIKKGYNAQLDRLYDIKYNANASIEMLRDKYRNISGVNSLKISKNNILGYFIEVTSSHASKIINPIFIHRQSLGNVTRYTSEELKTIESEIIASDERIKNLENEILQYLYDLVTQKAEVISIAANNVANLDVMTNLAHVAEKYSYVRPYLTDGLEIEIENGRHPVVEIKMHKDVSQFIPNDCKMTDNKNILLITGPNMAGKSTFLRQNAIIAIMAQMGSFVPASKVTIGIIDKMFTRIGAGDNIAHGQSTFMVEMLETAYIMNNATERSLLILDEIGRGTATYDGLAIAWAILENIHSNICARTIFATHYHELTKLSDTLNKLACYTMQVKEWEKKIVFMHKVVEGKADKSYGIHVAELAGMPNNIVRRAELILNQLNNTETS